MSTADAAPDVERTQVEADLDATPDEVWEAVTDPEQLGEWLGSDVALDPRPGGVGHVVDHEGTRRELLVTVVEPGERIGWHWCDERGEVSSVEITVVPIGDRTRVRVVETAAAAGPVTATARAGRWAVAVGCLHASSYVRA